MVTRIAVASSSRAEFGLLSNLCKQLNEDPSFDLSLLVIGSHLDPSMGNTIDEINNYKLPISLRVPWPLSRRNSTVDAINGASETLNRVGLYLSTNKPDLVIILGDRYEILSVAHAALMVNCPVAHIQGGELTLATIDESVRHALTKLSRFHFVAGESFAKRVQQMGESKDRVFNVGSLGVDNLLSCPIMSFEQLNNTLLGSLKHPFAVGTFHPVTLIPDQTIPAARAMLESILEHNIHLLLTGVNSDPGREILADVFNDYATRFSKQITYVESLGHVRYISAMNHCCFLIGNSSSGLIEAPAIPIPTINIGDRQRGRPSSPSVIDCAPEKDEIESAIKRILSSNFTDTLKSSDAAYGGKGAKDKIVDILKKISEDELRSPKQFEDYLICK